MADASVPTSYVVTCMFGLEEALADEVHQRLGAVPERQWCEVAFGYAGNPARLKELRVGLNVFLLLDTFQVGRTVPDLGALAERLRRIPADLWAQRWRELAGQEPGSSDVSISVTRHGEHNFTYRDVEQLALEVVSDATGRKTALDPRPLELRIAFNGPLCRLSGRLTATPLSRRPHRVYRAPNETDPTLAAAMVRYADPQPQDAFLDPFCGTGTIPIERAAAGPAGGIVAGEVSEKRVRWAAANALSAGAAVAFGVWDAFKLPFADRAFKRIVTAPPHGDPSTGRPWTLERFGPLLAESLRVLDFGGMAAWLVSDARTFQNALRRMSGVRIVRRPLCNWKGRRWTIFVIRKEL
jgi:23S rRNA G2445 N2-methylase RlmL